MSLSGLDGMYLYVEASEDNPLSHLVKFLGVCVVLTGNRLLHMERGHEPLSKARHSWSNVSPITSL